MESALDQQPAVSVQPLMSGMTVIHPPIVELSGDILKSNISKT